MAASPAQWLPDPQSLDHERLWDGSAWTDQTRDNPPVFDFDEKTDFFGKHDEFMPEPSARPRAPIIRLAPSNLTEPQPGDVAAPAPEAEADAEAAQVLLLPSLFDEPVTVPPVVLNFPTEPVPEVEVAPAPEIRKATSTEEEPTGAGTSTWIVGVPLLLALAVLGPANPSAAAFVFGAVLALTAIYALVTGRASWAKISGRSAAVVPLILSGLLLAGAAYLPTSIMVAPKLLSQPPSPTAEQTQLLLAGWTSVEDRLVGGREESVTVEYAQTMCLNDFASQTPDQEIAAIVASVRFPDVPEELTPAQATKLLDVVRASFCGYPGDRPATAEVVWSIPGLTSVIEAIINGPAEAEVTPAE